MKKNNTEKTEKTDEKVEKTDNLKAENGEKKTEKTDEKSGEKTKKLDERTKKVLLVGREWLAFSLSCVLFSYLPAVLINAYFYTDSLEIPFEILRICGLVFILASLIAFLVLRFKAKKADVKRIANKIDMTHEFAKNNIEKFTRKMKNSAFWTRFYIAFSAVFCLVISILFMAEKNTIFNVSFDGDFVFGAVFFVVPFKCAIAFFEREKPSLTPAIGREIMEEIYRVAEKAEKRLGLSNPIKIFVVDENNIGIYAYKEYLILRVGVNILQMMNAKEMENALLHEFAHAKNGDVYRTKKYSDIEDYISVVGGKTFGALCRVVFAWVGELYSTTFVFFNFCCRLDGELKADALERELGDNESAVAVSVKMDYYSLYQNQFRTENSHKNPEPSRRYFSERYRRFLLEYEKKGEFWKSISQSTLPFRLPTHPSVNQRKEFFGVDDPTIKFPRYFDFDESVEKNDGDGGEKADGADRKQYEEIIATVFKKADSDTLKDIKEVFGTEEKYIELLAEKTDLNTLDELKKVYDEDRAKFENIAVDLFKRFDFRVETDDRLYKKAVEAVVEKMDAILFEVLKENNLYENERKTEYEYYETQKNEFESLTDEQKAALDSMAYAKYGIAYYNLAEWETGEKLFDKAIEADGRNALALYQKGVLRLSKYDETGVGLVKSAIEKNENYIEDGSDYISEFLVRTGRKEEKDALRPWILEQVQRLADRDFAHSFKGSDKITEHEIPKMTVDALTAAAKVRPAIVEIQAFKKITKEGKPTNFVSLVLDGERAEELDEAYDAIFYILDNIEDGGPDYYLSVLSQDKVFAKNTKKLKNYVVYRR
jgi:Zn-dependent protease with chaperone function